LLWGILAAVALFKISSWVKSLGTLAEAFGVTIPLLKKLGDVSKISATVGLAAIAAAIGGLIYLIQNWGELDTWQKVIGILGVITAAALGAAMAFGVFHSAWSIGLAAAGIVAGVGAIAAVIATSQKDIENIEVPKYAVGGMPDKGSLFIAGEAGAEIVSTSSSGQTGVSNVQQIAQATYQGTMSALRDWWGGQNARGDIPQLTEANATGMYQAVTGVAKSYGKTWSNV
jgi:hypothetical protein